MNIIDNRNFVNRVLFIYLLFTCCSIACAQTDSTEAMTDSTEVPELMNDKDAVITEEVIANTPADSTDVNGRTFDSEKLNSLKADKNLHYEVTPTIAESLWDRFLMWLSDILNALFANAVTTNWGRIFVYILGLVVIVVIIMLILKVDAFKVFYSGAGKSNMNYQVLEENIHEMDFEKLIQEAISQHDYRKGVRLTFLYALKILSDSHHIRWESGKTNHDYVSELTRPELKKGFNELNFYFEYAWYGNFTITPDLFKKVQHTFSSWRNNVQ